MTHSGDGTHEDPVDIFERQHFPEKPLVDPTDTDDPTPPTASDAAEPARRRLPLWGFALIGVAIGLVIAWVIFNQGGGQPQMPAGHPPTDAPLATPTPLPPEEMAQLKAKVDAEPTNADHRLVYGVALYNAESYGLAEEQFLEAGRLDPADPAPWYNLGFLYLSLDPPDDAKAEAAWRKVVEIVPGSSMAETVGKHLAGLDSLPADATAGPTPDPSPTPGG